MKHEIGKNPNQGVILTKPQSESEITKAIRSVLKTLGLFHWKQWQGPMSQPKGVADILGIKPVAVKDLVAAGVETVGVFMAVEVKTEKGQVSPDQKRFLARVKEHGGIGLVARSIDDAIDGLGIRDRFLF